MNKTKIVITATILTFGVAPVFGNDLDSYRTFWEWPYIFLLVNLIVATALFSIIVGRGLFKEGIYTNLKQAIKISLLTYVLSTSLFLIISYFISDFDILLLPVFYQMFTKMLFFPVSVPLSVLFNYIILKRINLGNNRFEIWKTIDTLLKGELYVFPVTCFFAIFHI